MHSSDTLRDRATYLRQLAAQARDQQSRDSLILLAMEYEVEAASEDSCAPDYGPRAVAG